MPKILLRKTTKTAQYYTEMLGDVGLDIIRIPAGEFVMGAPQTEKDSRDNERPQHIVKIAEFGLGRYPITQKQWQEVAGWETVDRSLKPNPSKFKGAERPVEEVLWLQAKEFCARLSKRTEKHYRLPTEAEWEYACRAVIREKSSLQDEKEIIQDWNQRYQQPFYFGETLASEVANYRAKEIYGRGVKGEYRQQTTEVGRFPANGFGLCDMHGNVLEWCEDDYHESYQGAPADGSAWVEQNNSETRKVLRGGSWFDYPRGCRSADRSGYSRDVGNGVIGFRVAVSLP